MENWPKLLSIRETWLGLERWLSRWIWVHSSSSTTGYRSRTSATPEPWSEDRYILGPPWPASLPKLVSSICKIKLGVTKKDTQCCPLASTSTSIGKHTCTPTPTHYHPNTCTFCRVGWAVFIWSGFQRKEKWKQRWEVVRHAGVMSTGLQPIWGWHRGKDQAPTVKRAQGPRICSHGV